MAWHLTPRELQVVELLSRGLTNAEVARSFGISVNTVRTHRQAVMRKTHTHSIASAIAHAIRSGVIS